MAPTHFFLATSILLLSLLVIASADDYGYDSKQGTVKSETSYVPKSKPKSAYDNPNPNPNPNPDHDHDHDQPKLTTPKPYTSNPGYGYGPKSDLPEPNPNFKYDPKPNVDLPKLTVPKLPYYGSHDIPKVEHLPEPELNHGKSGYEPESLLPICIEGLVVCKSGSSYIPIEGALVRIACTAVDQNGYETSHFSCLTDATDAKGYYYKTLFPLGDLGHNLKLKECKAYLESSPLEACKIPTDVNNGISGALLSSYHILSHNNIKLYSMRTFFYTSETTSTLTPAGGY